MSKKLLINQNGEILATQSNGVTKLYSIEESGSGGGGGEIPIITLPTGTSTIELEPNKYYILTQPVATNLSLSLLPRQSEELSEYMLEIRADEDDIIVNLSEPIQLNEFKHVYSNSGNSFSFDGKYTYFLSIVNNKGLIGSTVNPKLEKTTISFEQAGCIFNWTEVPNAEYYKVFIYDVENTSNIIINQTYTKIPSNGISLDIDPIHSMLEGYVEACSNFYTDSKQTWTLN